MLSKTIKFTDYHGKEREKEYMFHFTEAECVELQFGTIGGLDALIKHIVETEDMPELIRIFKDVVLKAYGTISEDGMRFEKSEEARIAFSQTPAYSILFMELAQDAKKAAAFFEGVIPKTANITKSN